MARKTVLLGVRPMFDGDLVLRRDPASARQVRYLHRGGLHPVKIIYTGHPPVADQIAGQVRSSSGMTYGRRTHDGAKMPSAFTSYQFPRDDPPDRHSNDTVLGALREIAAAGDFLPTATHLRSTLGIDVMNHLEYLQTAGQIAIWRPAHKNGQHYQPGMAIRLTACGTILRTRNAPADIRFDADG